MWKIKQIFDGDYGCEELAEGQTPRVSVMLVDEHLPKRMEGYQLVRCCGLKV